MRPPIPSWSTWKQEASCHYSPSQGEHLSSLPGSLCIFPWQEMWKYFFKNQIAQISLLLAQSRQTACPQLWLVHLTPVHGQPRQGRPDNLLIKTSAKWTWQYSYFSKPRQGVPGNLLIKISARWTWQFGLKLRQGWAHNLQNDKTRLFIKTSARWSRQSVKDRK